MTTSLESLLSMYVNEYNECVKLGDLIKNPGAVITPERPMANFRKIQVTSVRGILNILPAMINESSKQLRDGIMIRGGVSPLAQDAIVAFDMYDSMTMALPSLEEIWKLSGSDLSRFDNAKRLVRMLLNVEINSCKARGLTLEIVRFTLASKARENSCRHGKWFEKAVGIKQHQSATMLYPSSLQLRFYQPGQRSQRVCPGFSQYIIFE